MNKRFLSLLLIISLCASLVLASCSKNEQVETTTTTTIVTDQTNLPDFNGLDDQKLLGYVEDNIYTTVVETLNSEDYFVENVSTKYISKEYLEELAFNSQDNIYFGYNLKSLEEQFQGTKFVFSTDEEATKTIVKEFEKYDDTYDQVVKNVAIGSGVILVCVTVSVVAAPSAPAISMIMAYSAKTGAIAATSSGAIGGITAGIIEGVQTKDFDKAKKAAALEGSKAFKWGAITGALSGGATEAIGLKGAATNGLTMNEAATVQKDSKYPLDVIKNFKSMDEYNVYKEAGLKVDMVNGKSALIRDIDPNYKSPNANGVMETNLERMKAGKAPRYKGPDGKPRSFELHHVNQDPDGTLALLTYEEHHGKYKILHNIAESEVDHGTLWSAQKRDFYKDLAKVVEASITK